MNIIAIYTLFQTVSIETFEILFLTFLYYSDGVILFDISYFALRNL